MKRISIDKDKIIPAFTFDPLIVEAIRTVDGRKWNKDLKRWEVPKENLHELLRALDIFDFELSPVLLELKQKDEVFQTKIDQIRSGLQPISSTLPLFDFQKHGASFLKAMPFALLADVPGLGKSIQTMAALENLAGPHLIFCPASLKYSWEAEITKWQPKEKVMVIDGDREERLAKWAKAKNGNFKYVIANYELLIHDYLEIVTFQKWVSITCDEATRISNPDAKTVKYLKTIKAKKKIALTGTPISNKPDDIWSIIDWMIPGYLGTYFQFRSKYCILEEDWARGREFKRISGYQNLDKLSEKVGRFMLRRTKEEVLNDFPQKIVENVSFSLSDNERKLYQGIKNQIIDEIHKLSDLNTRSLAIIPVKMLRLKQCTDHLSLVEGDPESSKMKLLRDMLEPIIASGEKAIIFTQFVEMLYLLEKELTDMRPVTIYGDVDSQERMVRVKQFNDDPRARIIIMSDAGAYGLNLQSASYVFHYDLPWSVAKLQQREDRAHRIGQVKNVTVYNLIAKDSIDEYVSKMLTGKRKVSNDILKDAERLSEFGLSDEDIQNILRL